jgi:hypothetical protein
MYSSPRPKLAMAQDAASWLGRLRSLSHNHLATQTVILLPIVVISGLTAWTMSEPPSAKGQGTNQTADQHMAQGAPVAQTQPSQAVPVGQATAGKPAELSSLKISSQSWRRGGLGSNALVTFTLRNDNDYAVGDIEIACSFSRQDGSHLTDRKRLIPDAVVDMKSRKTFARVHVGFVNIDANKVKCTPVAANRL